MSEVFLVFSLFFPRITLIIYYFWIQIPFNTIPFGIELVVSLFLPRVLVLVYIVQNVGTDSVWFWIHLVVAVIVFLSSLNSSSNTN